MIIETLSSMTILILCYIVWNLYNKVDFLEDVLDSNYALIKSVQEEMKKVDTLGSFESDDETGTTFEALKNEIERLDNLIEDKNNAT
tara:strand:+ start:2378 stop:2638 length:261 start_codon:yes stop_codon:yes gene_type:complete